MVGKQAPRPSCFKADQEQTNYHHHGPTESTTNSWGCTWQLLVVEAQMNKLGTLRYCHLKFSQTRCNTCIHATCCQSMSITFHISNIIARNVWFSYAELRRVILRAGIWAMMQRVKLRATCMYCCPCSHLMIIIEVGHFTKRRMSVANACFPFYGRSLVR